VSQSGAAELFAQVGRLRKAGEAPAALELLRSAIARDALSAEELERAGKIIAKEQTPRTSVRIVGQCTTSFLVPSLVAVGFGQRSGLRVTDGEYDNVVQEVAALGGAQPVPDVLVLLPWSSRLLRGGGQVEPRVAEELAFWQGVWRLAAERGVGRIVQIGYDWVVAGALGQHLGATAGGDVARVRRVNEALRRELPRGAYFVDLEQVSGELGRRRFYDPRQYHWTKQPFSSEGVVALTRAVHAGIRAVTTGPKKVLVLDLDNTLWGGVVGEVGALGVALGDSPDGEAFRALQKHVKALSERGVVLAVASKNNPEDAREPFEKNPDMVLSLADIAAFEAHWEPKATSLRRIAERLSLGPESFVFFDDNPVEREHVRQALPEVTVVEVSEEPADYVRDLQAGLWFETAALTEEDRARSAQYAAERQREELKPCSGSLDDYLRSLEMRAVVEPVSEPDMQRVAQLIGKTNQFNLTTRRHSEPEVRRLLQLPGTLSATLRLRDRFGDYGLVGLMIATRGDDPLNLDIDTWLMSCRVIGRTVEHYSIGSLMRRASDAGYLRLTGSYVRSAKNALVAELYPKLGFTEIGRDGSTVRYAVELSKAEAPETFVLPDS
jgi:FkbH-like protein